MKSYELLFKQLISDNKYVSGIFVAIGMTTFSYFNTKKFTCRISYSGVHFTSGSDVITMVAYSLDECINNECITMRHVIQDFDAKIMADYFNRFIREIE